MPANTTVQEALEYSSTPSGLALTELFFPVLEQRLVEGDRFEASNGDEPVAEQVRELFHPMEMRVP